MAALIKHGTHIRSCFILSYGSMSFMTRKFTNLQTKDNLPVPSRLKDTEASLSSKGFLRSQKPYDPPSDVRTKLLSISKQILGTDSIDKKIDNVSDKFKLLASCYEELNYSVPNSLLHTMETLGDIIKFYETPVHTSNPLDQMKSMELPPNLHVQHDYHRFHPDTDVMFGGISAFPKSSTIVTGLKYKKKYGGYNAKKSWP